MSSRWACALLCALAGCALPRPFAVDDASVARRLDAHFATVFGHGPEVPGLLAPRFGDPVLVTPGAAFPISVLEHGPAAPLRAALIEDQADVARGQSCVGDAPDAACLHVVLDEASRDVLDGALARHTYHAQPPASLAPGCYDLVTGAGPDVERARRAVCVVAPVDPARDLTVVQLSDIHVGVFGEKARILRRLRADVDAVNALQPDLIVITGDLGHQGHERRLEDEAASVLAGLTAPTLVVIGNHDYGHFPKHIHAEVPDRGYYNFAHAFHGTPIVHDALGAADFLGFDSGPSLSFFRVLTRGIGEDTLATIRSAITDDTAAGRRTVLFSHAPTRAALSSDPKKLGTSELGSMVQGGHELEKLLLDAGARGEHVLFLAGHTHWSDLFFARPGMSRFERVPFARLTKPVELDASAIMVNAPSATRIFFGAVEHGSAYGFVSLRLRARDTVVQFHLFDQHDRPIEPR